MKIVSVVGARPQFIKAAPLLKEFDRRGIDHRLVHTGQHYDWDMSQVFFDQLGMPKPDHELNVGSDSHAAQTAEIMRRLEPVLMLERPERVVIFGDTNSTAAAALTAAKMRLPIAHVEAGLRSFDRSMPEEINRVVADHVSDLLFAPNPDAARQLLDEGIRHGVHVVGDLMIDLALMSAAALPRVPAVVERLGLEAVPYAVATVHRASNTDDTAAFERILAGLRRIGMRVIFPVHPRTAPLVKRFTAAGDSGSIVTIDPVSYLDMIALVRGARVVLTDSGGLQKEAVALGVPCVTLRDSTEWIDTCEFGWNVLAGTDPDAIASLALRPVPAMPASVYGSDGRCAQRMADILLSEDDAHKHPSLPGPDASELSPSNARAVKA